MDFSNIFVNGSFVGMSMFLAYTFMRHMMKMNEGILSELKTAINNLNISTMAICKDLEALKDEVSKK